LPDIDPIVQILTKKLATLLVALSIGVLYTHNLDLSYKDAKYKEQCNTPPNT